MRRTVGWAATFSFVCVTWIFFRAATLSDAMHMVGKLPASWRAMMDPAATLAIFPLAPLEWVILGAAITLLFSTEYIRLVGGGLRDRISLQPAVVRYALMFGLVFSTLGFGVFNQSQFIYFQF